jgi:putative transferase (TIGR04331 family)
MQNENVFLATTALEDFWNTALPMVFLNPWCQKYKGGAIEEELKAPTLPQPYSDEEAARMVPYLEELHTRTLGVLTNRFNALHCVNYSSRYWTVLAGPWLLYYLHSQFDKYLRLKAAFSKYPALTTMVLDESEHIAPVDAEAMINLLKSDLYNLQLYSSMLKALGYRFPAKASGLSFFEYVSRAGHKSFSRFLIGPWKKLFNKALSFLIDRAEMVLHHSYFPRQVEFLLSLKTGGKIMPLLVEAGDFQDIGINENMRASIGGLDLGDSEFEQVLSKLIAGDMPKTLVEHYKTLCELNDKKYPFRPKAIFSSVSWYYDDCFKEWSGRCAETGTILIGTQHGGNYGSVAYFPQERYEFSIVDRYYSWGWERKTAPCRVVPMPATKVTGRKMVAAAHENGLLYVTTSWMRYLFLFPMTLDCSEAYIKNQIIFLAALAREPKALLRARPHQDDMGCAGAQRLLDACPGLEIEGWDIPFQESLERCSLYICDHCFFSTTFMEALFADKPSIVFHSGDFAIDKTHPDATPFYDGLRKAQILFDNPIDAAKQVNAVYSDPRTWWNEPQRREAVGRFKDRYLWSSSNAVNEWAREFQEFLAATKNSAQE